MPEKFKFSGWEFRGVVLVDPQTGDAYKAVGGSGGAGGDASAAKQDTGNATLAAMSAKMPALAGGAVPVTGSFFQTTQPVSGTFWQATQPVSGPVTDTQLRAAPVPVSLASVPSHAVTGPLTDTQLRAVAVPVSLSSVPSHAVTGPLTDTQLRAVAVPVSGSFFQSTQPVSGTFWQATQPVSAAALPLPTGAASETTLAALNAKFSPLGTPWQSPGASGGIISTTDVAVAAAAGASLRNYLKSLQLTNGSSTVSSEVVIKDGSTVIWRGFVGTSAMSSGFQPLVFDPPLRSTANTVLNIACLTTAMALRWNAQGYTAA